MTDKPTPLSRSKDPELDSFIQRIRAEKKVVTPAPDHPILEPAERTRRTLVYGAGLGFFASLLIALVSQILNVLMLAGVPMFRSFFDPLLAVLLIVIIGTLFSLLSVASITVQNRVAAVIGLLILIAIFGKFYLDYGTLLGSIMQGIGFLYRFLIPILFILFIPVPFVLLIRWVVSAQVIHHYRPFYARQRMIPALIMFAVAALLGSLFVYSAPERQAIHAMDALVAQAASSQAEVNLSNADGAYFLNAMHNPIPQRVRADGTPYIMDISVTAKYSSGHWRTCDFSRTTGEVIRCRSK